MVRKWPRRLAASGWLMFFAGSGVAGQSLPAQSPVATVLQRIGYADVEIRYSRPRVRGREIWDALVPYGEVWRTGADYPTFFEVSEAIRVEGKELPAGRYALYTIPGAETWTVIFSRETELWGAFGYEPSADALRVEVEPRPAPAFTESFTIEVADVTVASAMLFLRWADLEVPVRLESKTLERIVAAVDAAEPDDWGVPWRGAVALMDLGERPGLAAEWMERSLAVERNWMNLWTAAQLAAAAGESERAVVLGEEALATCEAASQYCPYSVTYAAKVEDWRGLSVEPAAGVSEPTGAGREPAAASHSLSFLVGAWCGAGETSGFPSTQRITWGSVLGGQFVKIHLHNRIQTSAGDYDFEGVGYYRPDGEDRLAGTWVDSQGVIHPISARLRGTELDATWGTEDSTLGRSVYRLADGRLEVEDYIHAGTWKRFGESKLERCD